MRNFDKDTNQYLSEVFSKVSRHIDEFNNYEDFSKFCDNRFILHNHVLFTILSVTAEGISDATQFVGNDHTELTKEISSIQAKKVSVENNSDAVISELDQIYNGFMNYEDLSALMSYKSRYDKHCNIPVYVRQANTRDQLIQKFIGFYAEDYIRLYLHDYKAKEVTTYDDDYWYAFFHWIGFRAVFNKLYDLGIDTRIESEEDGKIVGELVVFRNNHGTADNVALVKIPFKTGNGE